MAAKKMGVREFRDSFTTIAREAREPVIVTNHDKIVGWFTPASQPPRSVADIFAELDEIRRRTEARGINVDARLKALGLDDDALFGGSPKARTPKRKARTTARRAK